MLIRITSVEDFKRESDRYGISRGAVADAIPCSESCLYRYIRHPNEERLEIIQTAFNKVVAAHAD